ncbi:hypothetical protein [Dyella acidiphila]|uniref:Histone methylation protein DOT1 n=1 Tax=Dyella acidiphila TaxID=2775866 RepID=A0ABR9G605_9GAMM|nr:hypothetical protein [Dyella acidiphila]MBE1159460.1 hypothetical protein [Dyella acidiphila]
MTHSLQWLLDQGHDDRSLYQPECLRERVDLLDRLEEALLDASAVATDTLLLSRAKALYESLETINRGIYAQIRADIRHGHGARSLMQWVPASLFDQAAGFAGNGEQYDYLDALLAGVLPWPEPGDEIAALAPDMVFYQPTPARHIFDLIRRVPLDRGDVLMDLGAGLGHVPLVVSICTGAPCIGVEWENAYVTCAQQCARTLQLGSLNFLRQDARATDLSAASVFYLYTPFTGDMLRNVLDRLEQQALERRIRVCTLGPCTAVVAGASWLQPEGVLRSDRIALFHSNRA